MANWIAIEAFISALREACDASLNNYILKLYKKMSVLLITFAQAFQRLQALQQQEQRPEGVVPPPIEDSQVARLPCIHQSTRRQPLYKTMRTANHSFSTHLALSNSSKLSANMASLRYCSRYAPRFRIKS